MACKYNSNVKPNPCQHHSSLHLPAHSNAGLVFLFYFAITHVLGQATVPPWKMSAQAAQTINPPAWYLPSLPLCPGLPGGGGAREAGGGALLLRPIRPLPSRPKVLEGHLGGIPILQVSCGVSGGRVV